MKPMWVPAAPNVEEEVALAAQAGDHLRRVQQRGAIASPAEALVHRHVADVPALLQPNHSLSDWPLP